MLSRGYIFGLEGDYEGSDNSLHIHRYFDLILELKIAFQTAHIIHVMIYRNFENNTRSGHVKGVQTALVFQDPNVLEVCNF